MSNSNDSQCYFVQLQFDSFLDGELSEAQQESVLQHLSACSVCAHEFRYAKAVQDELLDLPLLDCPDQSLEAAHALARSDSAGVSAVYKLTSWIMAAPLSLRYGIPVCILIFAGLLAWPGLQTQQSPPAVASSSAGEAQSTQAQYSPEEVARALQDLSTAIQYLDEVSQRTENMIGGRFLWSPLQDSLNASFERVRNNIEAGVEGEDI